jgi:hypothetical protein
MRHSIRPFGREVTPGAAIGAGLTAIGLGVAIYFLVQAFAPQVKERRARRERTRDYSDRSGFPQGVEAARGAAKDFQAPGDMRIPDPLRPRLH